MEKLTIPLDLQNVNNNSLDSFPYSFERSSSPNHHINREQSKITYHLNRPHDDSTLLNEYHLNPKNRYDNNLGN